MNNRNNDEMKIPSFELDNKSNKDNSLIANSKSSDSVKNELSNNDHGQNDDSQSKNTSENTFPQQQSQSQNSNYSINDSPNYIDYSRNKNIDNVLNQSEEERSSNNHINTHSGRNNSMDLDSYDSNDVNNTNADEYRDNYEPNKDIREGKSKGTSEHKKMNIKRLFILIVICVVSVLAIWGLLDIIAKIKSAGNTMKSPETSIQTVLKAVKDDKYDEFEKLTSSITKNNDKKALFNQLKTSLNNAEGNLVSNFVVIRMENGKQYLCSLYKDSKANKYLIRSIEEIPTEMQKYFAK